MMRARSLPPIDVEAMDERLLDRATGHVRLMPAAEVLSYGLEAVQAWMVLRARYQLVTKELVEWLGAAIAGRSALEIGAGMGDLGHHLGIPMTDSGIQTRLPAEYAGQIEAMGAAPTVPPPDVELLDGEAAVAKHRPEVVVASWVTQKHHPGDAYGFEFGVEEIRIVRAVRAYLFVGNRAVHGGKRIARLKHRTLTFPWLVSRASEPSKNVLYVWGA
jgi:hypothetical protein